MPQIVAISPRCLVPPAECVAMRYSSSTLRLPSPRLSSSKYLCRSFHSTRAEHSNPVIISNSLEKTLEAHRSWNRTSLIRKVINNKPPAGIYRPVLSLEHHAGHDHSKPQGLSAVNAQPSRSPAPRKRTRRRPSNASQSRAIPYYQLQWSADEKNNRPEQRPWLRYLDRDHKPSSAIPHLHAEIRALERYMTPTPSEQERIDRLVADVGDLLAGIVPNPPQVIGSWRTRFALSHSDLDFVVPVPDLDRSVYDIRKPSATRPKMLATYHKLLRKVENVLQQSPSFSAMVDLRGSRSPVLTAIHHPTGRRLQFYCGEGPPPSIEYIMDYHAEYPSIRPLYVAARVLLETRGIYGRHQLSIGSDALVLLLVAFLKMNHGRFQRPDCLGEQLLAFLHTYGTDIDLSTTGVSVDPPSWFTAASVKEASRLCAPQPTPAHLRGQRALLNLKRTAAARRNLPSAARLCVQDPANYMNDLGRGCLRTAELQGAFSRAHDHLGECVRRWTEGHQGQASVLASALRANFDDFEGLRRMASCQ